MVCRWRIQARSQGFAAHDAYTSRQILHILHTCSAHQGNLLLNIGPAPDGSVPEESVEPLVTVGKWLKKNGEAVYGKTDRAPGNAGNVAGVITRKGKTAYFWTKHWIGPELIFAGFKSKLKKASFLTTGKPIRFKTEPVERTILYGMPKSSPDKLVGITVIKLEFATKYKHVFATDNPIVHG